MKLYLRILGYLRPHLGLFVLSIVATTVYAALDAFSFTLLIPFLEVLFNGSQDAAGVSGIFDRNGTSPLHRLLDWVVGDMIAQREPMSALRNVVLLLFFVFLLKNIAHYLQGYVVHMVQGRVTRDVRNQIYDHLLRLGFPFFQRTRTGQIISRVTSDVDLMRSLVTDNLAKALSNVLQALFYLSALLLLSWKLTLVALLSFPPMIGLWTRFRHRLRHGVLRVLDTGGEVASQIQETVSGIRVVKASGAEEWESERFRALTDRHYKALIRNERWRQFFAPATEMISAAAVLALLWYGSYLVLDERSLLASEFLTALLLAGKMMSPVKFLGNFPSQIQPGLAAGERAFELLDAAPEVAERPGARQVAAFGSSIRFEGTCFAYTPGEPVLEGIDLEIRPGQVVALVGPSGAGKSTLADLLPRFHDPTAGRIMLDGVDLRDLKLKDLRALMGIVTQETILFHDSVRANIAYGCANASQADVEAAARAANADDFIRDMPQGYDTVLGERGVRLSGGQRQRLAIARALLRNPPILILDEATSALDTQSERLVQQAIDELLHDRTVIVVAHRLSTVRKADQIVVLEGGHIVQRGTHEELLRAGGTYSQLYRLQFAEDETKVAASN